MQGVRVNLIFRKAGCKNKLANREKWTLTSSLPLLFSFVLSRKTEKRFIVQLTTVCIVFELVGKTSEPTHCILSSFLPYFVSYFSSESKYLMKAKIWKITLWWHLFGKTGNCVRFGEGRKTLGNIVTFYNMIFLVIHNILVGINF